MNFIWGLITGIVVATTAYLVWLKMKKPAGEAEMPKRDLMEEAKEKHAEMMAKLTEYIKGKTEIANDEVQQFLGVSDASAERYLNELEKEGKLEQMGKVGLQVKYKVILG